jgi:hypothetical protein
LTLERLPLAEARVRHWREHARDTLLTVVHPHGRASVLETIRPRPYRAPGDREGGLQAFGFENDEWRRDERLHALLNPAPPSAPTQERRAKRLPNVLGAPPPVRPVGFHDFNHDGVAEAVVASVLNPMARAIRIVVAVQRWDDDTGTWKPLAFLGSEQSLDTVLAGLRYADLDADGVDDVVLSIPRRYELIHVDWFSPAYEPGRQPDYSETHFLLGQRSSGQFLEWRRPGEETVQPVRRLPSIVREDGSDNGFFVHSGALYWQNEDTAHLPDLVERRSFADLLKGAAAATDRGAGR